MDPFPSSGPPYAKLLISLRQVCLTRQHPAQQTGPAMSPPTKLYGALSFNLVRKMALQGVSILCDRPAG